MGRKSKAKEKAKEQGMPGHHALKLAHDQRRRRITIIAVIAAVVIIGGSLLTWQLVLSHRAAERAAALGTPDQVLLTTSQGDITIDVYPKAMPKTVANFESLVKSGFYDGLTWFRIEDWVVQTGDPNNDGSGGSSQTINLETSQWLPNVVGAVGMARADDPNSASSQFYILKKDSATLNGQYAVFGQVVAGQDVVNKLTATDTITHATMVSPK